MKRTLYDFLRMIWNVHCSVSCSKSYGKNTVRLSTDDMERALFCFIFQVLWREHCTTFYGWCWTWSVLFHVLGPTERTLYDFLRMIWEVKWSVSSSRSYGENIVRLSTDDMGLALFCFMFQVLWREHCTTFYGWCGTWSVLFHVLGPMERTLYDFLRMIWDVKCSRVVMLTNTVELGRVSREYSGDVILT